MKDNILEKINRNNVKMTSKNYYTLKWITNLLFTIFFGMLAVYIFAYVVFLFVDSGLIYIPINSFTNLVKFIIEVPWTLVFLGCLSVFLFSRTSKTFYKIYKKPFLNFFFSIIIIILLSHIIFVKVGLMKMLKDEAYKDHLQLAPEKLLEFRNSQTGTLFNGYVVATTTTSIIIETVENETLEVTSDSYLNYNEFLVGTHVNAYGERINSRVYANKLIIVE